MTGQPDRNAIRARIDRGLPARHRKEALFRIAGFAATAIGIVFLLTFLWSLVAQGASAFMQTYIELDVHFSRSELTADGEIDYEQSDFDGIARRALRDEFPEVQSRSDRRDLNRLLSIGAGFQVRDALRADPGLLGTTAKLRVLASANVDMVVKGKIDRDLPEVQRPLSDAQFYWVDSLIEDGRIGTRFNTSLFQNGDSREPELAGIRGALMGSVFMLLITAALSFPVGAAAAIYLEEFAPRNRWADFIEVNINNLAAVPSIIFGLLGLAVFINWLSVPRSSPLVGGLVLSLMTMPVVIIAARAAIQSVPQSIRDAALGLGASRMQVVFHHVLPLAMPGMLTGAIIGMSRALGETAPLLMIGMVAFIVDVPTRITDPATALPVQVYLWADSPERAFAERTSAAIIVLLVFLLVMNLTAVLMRKRLER